MDISQVTKTSLIYSTPYVQVYKGLYLAYPVIIKEVKLPSKDAISNAYMEFQIQKTLEHPNICRVYECFLESEGFKLVMIIEALEFDLMKEIVNRRDNEFPWTEEELWGYFWQLIDALAYAQRFGVCHRDIKPHNIFVSSDKQLKIGDFGSAKILEMSTTSTIVGTTMFISPELQWSIDTQQPLQYNPYQSDVYSLGMTFLCMVLLRDKPAMRSENILTLIDTMQVSAALKGLLQWMLLSENRPDFLVLQTYLYGLYHQPAENTEETPAQSAEEPIQTIPLSQSIPQLQTCQHCNSPIPDSPVKGYFCSLECYNAKIFEATQGLNTRKDSPAPEFEEEKTQDAPCEDGKTQEGPQPPDHQTCFCCDHPLPDAPLWGTFCSEKCCSGCIHLDIQSVPCEDDPRTDDIKSQKREVINLRKKQTQMNEKKQSGNPLGLFVQGKG